MWLNRSHPLIRVTYYSANILVRGLFKTLVLVSLLPFVMALCADWQCFYVCPTACSSVPKWMDPGTYTQPSHLTLFTVIPWALFLAVSFPGSLSQTSGSSSILLVAITIIEVWKPSQPLPSFWQCPSVWNSISSVLNKVSSVRQSCRILYL